ncbi:hypothetical protein B5X24_HaOG215696 [Helicoverpa armigera]|uniref:GMP synthase C-terminal domain-containing protein n=1 Tax=Helicoverpa armigera TaxID=29058 RepID=A0A2W1AZU7_HELAM|nr:hypothetical protein B5X24_HaOG215696 [Helicoverpa armigera]
MCVKSHALLGRVANASTPAEQAELKRISSKSPVAATLLPLRSVGVQGDGRTVCYAFGGIIKEQVTDITPTFLTQQVISTLRQADDLATQILVSSGCASRIAQMPVVMIPIHFDRDAAVRAASCQRSLVLRPFLTQDFMTGVVDRMRKELLGVPGISRVLYDLTPKPPATTEWE